MTIGIISTEQKTISALYKVVTNYSLKKLFVSQIDVFSDANNFLNSQVDFDILFIDDTPKAQNLLNVTKEIRTLKPTLTIIMLSSNRDHVYEAFPLKVHRFILKPFSEASIYEALDAYRRDRLANGYIIVRMDKKYRTFFIQDIFYIDGSNRNCTIHTRNDSIATNTYFPGIEEQLPKEFFFTCYRNISVNMTYVREFSATQIVLHNGVTLPLSKRRKMDFYVVYNDFVKGHTL